ncbi:DUF58 domain-containing protein [Bacillus sp. FJAT-49711]|uniref:DUF58 domain-containing protein n=1 Tax=Bacillus sp. FJAT-49711 TaxID=2833585 RepID=UPI001BC9B517|nr:DUF58 domain-containing protein [Bacillus sp. FJAT-49711]MBS4217943.1 DUF58 domain-containing protein [Bacillus sp. FJAT-49711]
MKQWFRLPNSANRSLYYTTRILFLFVIIAFIVNQLLTMFIFVSCLVILLLHSYYLKVAGNQLHVVSIKEKNFLIIDDEDRWKIILINKGMPIFRASLKITFEASVIPSGIPYKINNGLVEATVPISIWKDQEKEIFIPVTAHKRGKSQIRELIVRIPHLFGSGHIDLMYQNQMHTHIFVYPERISVYIPDLDFKNKQGLQDVKTSLFNDTMNPIGIRNYIAGDPFQHIHWKASAKMQSLQSKEFSRVASRGWMIIMNISEHYSVNARLEEMIAQTAFMIDYALKKEIPFSLAVNIRTSGKTPYYYLNEGQGQKHRQAALELLTILSFSSLSFPTVQMLSHLKNEDLPTVIIYSGSKNMGIQHQLMNLSITGRSIYEVENIHGKGVLRQWKQKKMAL